MYSRLDDVSHFPLGTRRRSVGLQRDPNTPQPVIRPPPRSSHAPCLLSNPGIRAQLLVALTSRLSLRVYPLVSCVADAAISWQMCLTGSWLWAAGYVTADEWSYGEVLSC